MVSSGLNVGPRYYATVLLGGLWAIGQATDVLAQTRFSFTALDAAFLTPIVFAPDGRLLALAGDAADIVVLDLHEGRKLVVFEHAARHSTPPQPSHIEFTADSRTLVAVFLGDERDKEIIFFDIAKAARRASIPLAKGTLAGRAALFPDGSKLAVVALHANPRPSQEVQIWGCADLRLLKSLDSARSSTDIAFSPDGKWLATVHGLSDAKGQVVLWDAATLERRTTLRANGGWLDLAFSRDGKFLATGVNHHKSSARPLAGVQLWDVSTGKQLGWMDGYDGADPQHALARPVFSPDGLVLVATFDSWPARETLVKLWNTASREFRVLDRGKSGPAPGLTARAEFSMEGALLASPVHDGKPQVKLWDTRHWRQVAMLDMSNTGDDDQAMQWWVNSIRFSPDGNWLAARRSSFLYGKHEVVLWKLSEVLGGSATSYLRSSQ